MKNLSEHCIDLAKRQRVMSDCSLVFVSNVSHTAQSLRIHEIRLNPQQVELPGTAEGV